jgi:hypothetical protein
MIDLPSMVEVRRDIPTIRLDRILPVGPFNIAVFAGRKLFRITDLCISFSSAVLLLFVGSTLRRDSIIIMCTSFRVTWAVD